LLLLLLFSTRPFLTTIEKKWITYQLISAVEEGHLFGICHGDIKCENVLITSWNWIYLSDFAPYKPTYIPDDNPADFSYYFDSSGRRTCYIAPERFLSSNNKAKNAIHNDNNDELQPSMDIFSLG
jgi:phosphoinositide-3-kinase regulatory subunit 4